MGNVPERVTAKEARKAVDVMCHRPYTPDERRTAFRYIDQTEAEVARLRGELEWEKAVTEAALDRHDYIAARFKVLKAEVARLREALEEIARRDPWPASSASVGTGNVPESPLGDIARRALNRETTDA